MSNPESISTAIPSTSMNEVLIASLEPTPTLDKGALATMGIQSNEVLSAIETKNFQNFIARIGRRSSDTQRDYARRLRWFTSFLQKSHPDETIAVARTLDPYDLLDAFAGWLIREGYGDNTVITTISVVKKWLRYNGIKVYNEDVKDRVELPKSKEAIDDAPTKAEIRKLLNGMRFQTQNKMLMLTCTGVRPVDLQYLRYSDFKWDEHPVRLIVPPYGKTGQGWETFITEELTERLKEQKGFGIASDRLWKTADRDVLTHVFRKAVKDHPELDIVTTRYKGGEVGRHRLHLYSLKKFFFSQVTAEVGDVIAHAWCGRKSYLSTYLRLPLEEKQKLYLRVMSRLTVFSQEQPKTQDILRERLLKHGLTEGQIADVLERLVLN